MSKSLDLLKLELNMGNDLCMIQENSFKHPDKESQNDTARSIWAGYKNFVYMPTSDITHIEVTCSKALDILKFGFRTLDIENGIVK